MSDNFGTPTAFSAASFDQLANDNPAFANGSPGLAYDAFTAPSAAQAVPALAQAASSQANSDAIQQHATGQDGFFLWNWLGNAVHAVTSVPAVNTALTYLNKPLEEVQKDYKFLHSVYSRQPELAPVIRSVFMRLANANG